MAILEVIVAPDPILKKKALPVVEVNDSIRKIMDDMLETMYADNGAGLSANQIGVLKQIIVIDLQEDDDIKREKGFYPLYIADPIIIEASEKMEKAVEGCLSVPGQRIEVLRPSSIKVKYRDYYNNLKELETAGWLARAIQHEMDHLEGKLLLDYLSPLKKDVIIRKLAKLKKQTA